MAPLALEVRDLVVPGEDGRPILVLPVLDLAAGGTLGVAGPSGAGKSTLLLALAGLAPGMTGRVAWGGADIAAMRPAARARFRRRHLGLVFQDHLLLDELDAGANAALAALWTPRGDRARIRRAARLALDVLGVPALRRAALLSGGERQRAAIARALATAPSALLADEPTASLHADAAVEVGQRLAALRGAQTLVAASHDAAFLARLGRVLRVEHGAAVAVP